MVLVFIMRVALIQKREITTPQQQSMMVLVRLRVAWTQTRLITIPQQTFINGDFVHIESASSGVGVTKPHGQQNVVGGKIVEGVLNATILPR